MKKNTFTKVTSILAAAIMTASAAFTTVSADETNASMALQNVEAAAGGTVEIPLTIYSDNQCMAYDLILEHDSALKYVETYGATAIKSEEAGKNLISMSAFALNAPFKDGETAATITFEVPKDASIGDVYTVDFSSVNFFGDFEDYTLSGATVTVNKEYDPSVEAEEEVKSSPVSASDESMITLEGREALAGELVEVPLIMYTNNKCTSYDILVEYDSRFELQKVLRANGYTPYEEDGKKFVSITGFGTSPYKDGTAAASILLYVPEDAETDSYEVKINQVSFIATDDEEIANYTTSDTSVSVKGNTVSDDGKSEIKVYARYGSGAIPVETMTGVRGDVNNDGNVSIKDAVIIAKACAKRNFSSIDEKGMFFGDVNDDGVVSIKDAMIIAKYIAKGRVSWNF